MGKKTNWTLSEDQALCRAWLCASDAALGHQASAAHGDQKAGTFWGVVHQLFHAELETSVDRPVTGLKIRWTRINRDVQRFAIAFARVQAAAPPLESAADAEAELERERQAVDEATELFLKEQGAKFTFESCWRLLRFSPRWMQLLANSAGMSSSAFHATAGSSASAALLAADSATAAAAGGGIAPGPTAVLNGSGAGAMALQKRRLGEFLDAHNRSFPESSTAYLAAIAQELARQSDLLEEQNAIALFRMELDLIDDDDAREYFANLRHTYAKRMRRDEPIARETVESHEGDETDVADDGLAQRDGKETAEL